MTDLEVNDAVRALAALVLAIERAPTAPAAVAYKARIRTYGEALAERGGAAAMHTVLVQMEDLSPAHTAARRSVIVKAWSGLPARE